eukprot:3144057-Prymnesium_polylepis.1
MIFTKSRAPPPPAVEMPYKRHHVRCCELRSTLAPISFSPSSPSPATSRKPSGSHTLTQPSNDAVATRPLPSGAAARLQIAPSCAE